MHVGCIQSSYHVSTKTNATILGSDVNLRGSLSASQEIKAAIAEFVKGKERSVAIRSLRGSPQISMGAHEDVQRPAASLLKLPLAMTLWDMAKSGDISLSKVVRESALPKSRYPSIINIFDADHNFLLREICGLMLSVSDNPCTQYIINLVTIDRVNESLQAWRCDNSLMVTGYSDNELLSPLARSNYTTASDLVKVMALAYSQERYSSLLEFLKQGVRKYRLPHYLPEDLPVANKTGSLSGVANDAAIIYGNSYDLAVAVLTDAEDDDMLTGAHMGNLAKTILEILGERLEEIDP
jgi:beta-lactamase class A